MLYIPGFLESKKNNVIDWLKVFKAFRISGTAVLGLWRNQCVNTSRPPTGPDEVKWNASCVNTALTFSISTLSKACRQLFLTINMQSFCAFKMSFCKSLQRCKLAAVLWHGLCTSLERGPPQVVIGTLTSYQEIKFEHRSVQKNSRCCTITWVALYPSSLESCLYHIEHQFDINKWCHSVFVDSIFIVFHCLCRYVCHVTLAEDHCCRTSWTYLRDQGNSVKYRSDAHMWQRWFKRKLLCFWKSVTPLHMHTCIHTYIHISGKLRACR